MSVDTGQTVTIKIKLLKFEIPEFDILTVQYTKACNYVSRWIFDHDFVLNQAMINKALYYYLRNAFNLKAQLAQSVIRTVVTCYKTARTQLKQKPFKFYSKTPQCSFRCTRDLYWLKRPLKFRTPQADLQRTRDWSFVGDQLSINTLGKRIKVDYVCKGFNKYLNDGWKLGLAKLIKRNNRWYFCISATKKLPEYQNSQTEHIVGIDRGIRFLATCYDEYGKTKFFSGREIMHKRNQYKQLRAQLQSKGTKSAKRRLKKIGQRENRWMSDVNHCLSKTLVDYYGKNTLFVIEDLTGVTFNTAKDRKKQDRYVHNSWAFYQLEQDLTYKANLNHSKFIKVDPEYTSQRCIKCGRINKDNRNHDKHLYICDHCSYASNDDRIAAMNIQQLGVWYLNGMKNPKFNKN